MNGTSGNSEKTRGRGVSVFLGIILLFIAVMAVLVGRGTFSVLGFGAAGDSEESSPEDPITVKAVIGSEKRDFFEDPKVREVLADHGYDVQVTTAGSRRIATELDLSDFDLAFPSSAPAAQKILETVESTGEFTPFNSPITIATWGPILHMLERADVARAEGGHWYVDMEAYITLAQEDIRWRDLGDDFPSPGQVQMSSTDVRTSNSAAMYLSLLSWAVAEGSVVGSDTQVDGIAPELGPFFLGQGYTESTSAGPFADYLSQGMGSKPMAVIYEAQFLNELAQEDTQIAAGDSMVLAYPYPTVITKHTVVGLTDEGAEIGRLLAEDEELQKLAAVHGFRPQNSQVFTETMAELNLEYETPANVLAVDPPDYDILEQLIERVSASYSPLPPFEEEDQ